MWVRVYLILLRDRTDVIKGVFFGVVACKLFCVLMVLLCGGVGKMCFFRCSHMGLKYQWRIFRYDQKCQWRGSYQ